MAVVRYVLSFLVLIAHTATLARVDLPVSSYSFIAVGGFFALSGFLLFASFQKRPVLRHYLSRRALRILPPYFLIVIVCAVLLVAVSSLDWREYYSDSGFWEYLAANISFLNFLHPSLPGVFEGPQFVNSAVNGSLWTMKGEWLCYLSVPALFFIVASRPRLRVLIVSGLIVLCLLISNGIYDMGESTGKEIYFTLSKQFSSIFVFFYIGCLINMLYDYFLRYRWLVITIDLLLLIVCSLYPSSFYYMYLRPFVISVLVLWFSQVGRWGYFMRGHEDLSYDIYLFHYPIIQLSVYLGLQDEVPPMVLLLIIAAVTTTCAYLSWNLVGKKFKKLQKNM